MPFLQNGVPQNIDLANLTPEQQLQMIAPLTPEYLRELIAIYRKQLDPKRLEALVLSRDNTLAL